ncbi:MAG: UDP-N-acetylmuramate--L-alanine ligase [Anaerolineae bacterium]
MSLGLIPGIPKNIHMAGIGGIGISAIALVLAGHNHHITGSDQKDSATLAFLREYGIHVHVGHNAENLGSAQLVVISSAIPETNVEVQAARRLGIPVVKRRTLLALMMAGSQGIAVAGTHGKTTTAAMLAVLLERLGQEPTYIVGGIISDLGTNAGAGAGRTFVLEADEYDHAFQDLAPYMGIVTNIEMDHPDCYADLNAVCAAFDAFMQHINRLGHLVTCVDNPQVRTLLECETYEAQVHTYGLAPDAEYRLQDIVGTPDGGITWRIIKGGAEWLKPTLTLAGKHNALNATAVLIAAEQLGLNLQDACQVLASFKGVARRFELKGEVQGIVVIDDYAHHPTQIRETLAATRQRYPERRIWAMFQPHTYSRTLALWSEFTRCFDSADEVIISDIYQARSSEQPTIHARDLALAVVHPLARWIGPLDEVVTYLLQNLTAGDLLITLGAGDGSTVGERVLAQLRARV